MNASVSSPPCEACPPHCNQCAWGFTPVGRVTDPKRRLTVVRTSEKYGCFRQGAAIVVDHASQTPLMQVGDDLLPLSADYGHVIADTQLEKDIKAALAA